MRKKNNMIGLFIILNFINFSCNNRNTKEIEVQKKLSYEIVVPDLNIPWGFTFLPDKSILITEKKGKLWHYKNNKKTAIKGLPKIALHGQGGLLDITIHPDFTNTPYVYFTYTSPEGDGGYNTALMRATLQNDNLVNHKLLYKGLPNSELGFHFGSRIQFDREGFLYFSIGDRGNREKNPQDLARDGGKIYRLNADGSIPKSNPFVSNTKARKAIYSFGHRNPQGMTMHPETGAIWTHEHGPRGGDEINIIEAGKNYGWPKISYGINYDGTTFTEYTQMKGMEQPLHHWTPSIAPSGMAFISSDKYGEWQGNLLVGSLKFQYINRCVLKNNKVVVEEKLLEGIGRVRSIEQGPDGFIYAGVERVGIIKLILK